MTLDQVGRSISGRISGTREVCWGEKGQSSYLMVTRQRIHDAKQLTAPCLASVMLIACKAQDGRG